MWDKVLAMRDRVCTQSANSWIFRSFQQRYVRKLYLTCVVIQDNFFSHTFVEKIENSMNLLPVCKLYPALLPLLSHTASSVAYAG